MGDVNSKDKEYEKYRKRDKKITVWTSEAERNVIKGNAAANEMSVTDYLRTLGLENKRINISPEELANLSMELNSIRRKIDIIAQDDKTENEELRYEELKDVLDNMQNTVFQAVSDLYEKYM